MQTSLQWARALYSRMGRVDGSWVEQLVPLASVCVPSLNRTKGLWPFKTPGDWSTGAWGTPRESPRVSSPLKTLRRLTRDIIYAWLRTSEDRPQWLPRLSFPDLESEVWSTDGKPSIYTTLRCFLKKVLCGRLVSKANHTACGPDRHPKQKEVIRLLIEVLTFLAESVFWLLSAMFLIFIPRKHVNNFV